MEGIVKGVTAMGDEQMQEMAMDEAPARAPSKKWQWLFQMFGFLGFVAAAVAAVVYLPVFKLETIDVKGTSYIPPDDVLRIAGVRKGQHMFQVETGKAVQNLRKDIRIEQAIVKRTFPNGIYIEVEERRPVACVACEFGFLDLDRKGMVLNAYRVRHLQTIPFLAGIAARDLYIGDMFENEQIILALQYLSSLDETELAQIAEMNLANPGYVVVRTTDAAEIRIGVLDRIEEKVKLTKSFLGDLRTTQKPIKFIDLTTSAPFIPAIDEK